MDYKMTKLKVEFSDPLIGKYRVKADTGREYLLERDGDQLFLYNSDKGLGRIVQNDHLGGSIWHGDECLGEYDLRSGEYIVTPYAGGLKHPDQRQQVHPLDYLVKKVAEEQKNDCREALTDFAEQIGAKEKKPEARYFTVSFASHQQTLEEVFGSAPMKAEDMYRKLWDYVRENKLLHPPQEKGY